MNAKAKISSSDIISSLPQNIIETILCLLPINDAGRTSVLSKKWRYNWTTIPKILFNGFDMIDNKEDDGNQVGQRFRGLPNHRKHLTDSCKVFYAIYQVLLLHRGPLLEFTLEMNAGGNNIEIDQIIIHLSRNNTVKKLTFNFSYRGFFDYMYKVPVSIFSLHHLTDLYLHACTFDFEPTFSGFCNLTSLSLVDVKSRSKTLVHLLSGCPSLKHLDLTLDEQQYDEDSFTVIELFKCLPVIERMSIHYWTLQRFIHDGVTHELPAALVHLKYLRIYFMMCVGKYQIPTVVLLIRSSPNLEKLKLEIIGDDCLDSEPEIECVISEEYSDIWLEHLNEVEIRYDGDSEYGLEFVKLLLAKSPVLKKVTMLLQKGVDENLIMRTLLRSPRASPTVQIIVDNLVEDENWS